ncbi:hypothetical protein NE865_06407 [Phthorimaea operculella]|nr:hypothetical protein NE865_06407 [Phthorimaea operculella]
MPNQKSEISELGERIRRIFKSPADIRSELPNHQQPEAENTHEPVSAASAENSQSVSNDVEIVPGSVKEGAPVENTETTELDISILEILGDDPTLIKSFGAEIQKDLAVRLEHCVTNGLSKEIRKELKEKYLIPSNCKLINAPVLNAEIKAAVSDQVAKRDKAIEIKQSQVASAIAALSQALTHVLSSSDKDSELIKILMDTSRLLCDCQHSDSITRRNFILSTLKKDMKDQLQNSKVDNYLFGENFAETIKTAKAITKSGAELKAAPADGSSEDEGACNDQESALELIEAVAATSSATQQPPINLQSPHTHPAYPGGRAVLQAWLKEVSLRLR